MAGSSQGTNNDVSDWYLFRIGTFEHSVLIPLDRNELVIGRISNKYLKKSPFVSRKHACFLKLDGNWHVEDLGSTNGIFVNNVKINSGCIHPVYESDVVGLGMATATSEDRFSFQLCRNPKFQGTCERGTCLSTDQFMNNTVKTNNKRLSSDTSNSGSTVENIDSVLHECTASTLEQPLQQVNADGIPPRKLGKTTKLSSPKLSNGNKLNLRSSPHFQCSDKDCDLPTEIKINNPGDTSILERITETPSKQCTVSKSQSLHTNENVAFKQLIGAKEVAPNATSCNRKTNAEKHNVQQGTSFDHLECASSHSALKRCSSIEFSKTLPACKLKKTIRVCNFNRMEKDCTHQQSSIENENKDMCISTDISEPNDTLLELIEIKRSVRRKSTHQSISSRHNQHQLIDLSTAEHKTRQNNEIEIEFHNSKKRNHNVNVITVPDDGTSIIESIEIKEEVITLSDCDDDDDDDCVVVDDSNKTMPILSQCMRKSEDEVKNDAMSQPSFSNNCVSSTSGKCIELDESSNDTHFSETVDDCVEFESSKPELNIDENRLLSRISWPELPAD